MDINAVAAVRRTHQSWYAYGTRQESLTSGIAFYSAEHPRSPQLNQFREVQLAGVDLTACWQEAEGFFRARGLRCGRWVPAADQSAEPLGGFLMQRGFIRADSTALLLTAWPERLPTPDIRLLPVRTVLDHYKQVVAEAAVESGGDEPAYSEAAEIHVDDPQLDLFVALRAGGPAGFGELYQVGDIACVRDVFVSPEHRGQGVGRAIVAHLVALARRLSPRVICASAPAGNGPAIRLLGACGFEEAGRMPEFHRLRSSS